MSTKYVLQPDGSILKIEETPSTANTTSVVNEEITNLSKDIVEENFGESYRKSNFNNIKKVDLDSGEDTLKDNLINYVSSNKSFDFINESEERELNIPTFKNFRSFSDIDQDTRMFANELELIGAHLSIGEPKTLISIRYLFFLDYILEIAGLITAIELVTSISEAAKDNDVVESSMLSLGNYTFSTPDFISPYFLKVLNYPTKLSNTNDRLASFFLGLNLYLGGDESIKGVSDLLEDTITDGLKNSALRVITATLLYSVEGLLQTGAKDNLLDLLIRKFQMQKYWHEEQLYKAKGAGLTEKLMAEFKYYYFKFAIERMHIGLKSLNWKYYGLTYDVFSETPLTRVGLSRARLINNNVSIKHASNNNRYEWNPKNSGNSNTQSIRNRALPQALQLPVSFLANKILNEHIDDLTAEKAIISIDKSLGQNFVINKTNRIDKGVVRLVETQLEAEYVPFYFHDIRTNEIIAFHAFIENLTDSFSPEYVSTSGFGRIDDVKNYVKTTRSIQISFLMASTSPEDHDLMWYQVNKLVSMCYPQWSNGFVSNEKTFEYPFTQMPTASPLIRLRVGDIIKSNYSKQNLSRIHGIGNRRDIDEPLRDAIFNDETLGTSINKVVNNFNKLIEQSIEFYNEKNSNISKSLEKSKIQISEIDKTLNDLNFNLKKLNTEQDANESFINLKISELESNHYSKMVFLKQLKEKDNWMDFIKNDIFLRQSDEIQSYQITLKDLQSWYDEIELEYDTERKSINSKIKDEKQKNNSIRNNDLKLLEERASNNDEVKRLSNLQNKLTSLTSPKKSATKKLYYLRPGLYREEKSLGGDGVLGQIAKFAGISEKSYRKIDVETKVELIEAKSDYVKVKLNDDTLLFADKNKLKESSPIYNFKKKGKEEVEDISELMLSNTFNLVPLSIEDSSIVAEENLQARDSIIDSIDNVSNNLTENIMASTIPDTGTEDVEGDWDKEIVNNPFTAAFESAQGKGLAGFITSLNIGGIMESPWETSRIGSKAPLMVKIDIGFTPIHDIPPGLDHDGMMRAPTYNVGRLMNELFDDVYEE